MTTDYAGIDYSGPGASCNRDAETGCRYGIISANDLDSWLWERVESVYTPSCPKCGGDAIALDAIEDEHEEWDEAKYDCIEFGCQSCEYLFGESGYGDEPDANVIDSDGIKGFVDSQNDAWVVESPYFTYAQFCSPCAPGAGHLGNPTDEDVGPKTYCFPKDWFTDDKCPYPYWSVETGELVYSPE